MKQILLIEDNPSDIELTRRAFEREHILNELIVVDNGQAALEYLFCTGPYAGRDPYDLPLLILLDLNIPVVDGLDVLRQIRANERTRRLLVIILTSSLEEQDISTSYDLHVNSYIRKPVDFQQFARVVEQLGMYWLVLNEPPQVPTS